MVGRLESDEPTPQGAPRFVGDQEGHTLPDVAFELVLPGGQGDRVIGLFDPRKISAANRDAIPECSRKLRTGMEGVRAPIVCFKGFPTHVEFFFTPGDEILDRRAGSLASRRMGGFVGEVLGSRPSQFLFNLRPAGTMFSQENDLPADGGWATLLQRVGVCWSQFGLRSSIDALGFKGAVIYAYRMACAFQMAVHHLRPVAPHFHHFGAAIPVALFGGPALRWRVRMRPRKELLRRPRTPVEGPLAEHNMGVRLLAAIQGQRVVDGERIRMPRTELLVDNVADECQPLVAREFTREGDKQFGVHAPIGALVLVRGLPE